MSLFNKIKDSFTSTEFHVESTMKVSELNKKFSETFDLSLRVYKGKALADDGRMTIKSLDQRTTKSNVKFDSSKLKIKATLTVDEVEKLFMNHFGLIVQIADKQNKKLVPNEITLGDAKRLK